MSVVNDVLKNLNQRKSLDGEVGSTPYYFQDQPKVGKWLWFGVCCVLTTVLVISYNDFNQDSKSDIYLPEDVFLASTYSEEANRPRDLIEKNTSRLSLSKEPLTKDSITSDGSEPKLATTINTQEIQKKDKVLNSKKETNVVQRTAESKASESVVDALNTGDIDQAKVNLSNASKRVQNEVQLRLLLKENPKEILPRIRRFHPNFIENPSLLALAAQGQQRAGSHESAVELYTKLIPLEPNDARWRSGLAISLEKLGDSNSAKRLYKLALSMGGLPYSLKRFSESRLERLEH